MSRQIAHTTRGVSLIETLVASGVFVIFVSTLGIMGFSGLDLSRQGGERMEALRFAEEGIEVVRVMRSGDIAALTPGEYGLATTSMGFVLTSTPDKSLNFIRKVIIDRPSNNRIRLVVRVEKEGEPTRALVELTTYVHDLYSSSFTHTTSVDFTAGGKNGSVVRNDIGDGAVSLPIMGNLDLLRPHRSADALGASSVFAIAESRGIIVTGGSVNGEELVFFDTNNISSGQLTKIRGVNIGANISAVAVVGNYAYAATDGNDRELVVVRVSDGVIVRTLDMLGTANAAGLSATGTTLYLSRLTSTEPEMYKFSITNPEVSLPQLASLQVAGDVYGLARDNSMYLYGATSADTREVVVISESTFALVTTLDLPGGANARGIAIREGVLYVTRLSSAEAEVVAISISNPIAGMPISASAQVAGTVYGVTITSDDKIVIAAGVTAADVIILDSVTLAQRGVYDVTTSSGSRSVLARGPYVYVGMTTSNPELVVLRGSNGSWESPSIAAGYDTAGTIDGLAVWSDGVRAYLGTANQSAGPELYIFNVSTPSLPVLLGSVEIGANVNAVTVVGNIAYLATAQSSRELSVVNVTNPALPAIVGSYNAPGAIPATSLTASGTTIYLGTRNNTAGTGRELYVVNVTVPTLPILVTSFEVGANVNAVERADGRLLLGTASDPKELIVLDATNPSILTELASYDTPNVGDGLSVAWTPDAGGFLILGTQNNGAGSDFYTFTLAQNGAPILRSFLDLSGDNRGVSINAGVALIGNSRTGGGLTVLNVENPFSPIVSQHLSIGGIGFGVSLVGASAVIANTANTRELTIVIPANLPTRYGREGWFTSSVIDAGDMAFWQQINWTMSGTGTVAIQIRTAATEVAILNASWFGPGVAHDAQYMSSGEAIEVDPAASSTQFLQYRVSFFGDGITVPILEDVTLIYN